MEIDDTLAMHGAEGLVATVLRAGEQELKIEFLMHVLSARINTNDPQAAYQSLQRDCRLYVAEHSQHLTPLREHLDTLDKVRKELSKWGFP